MKQVKRIKIYLNEALNKVRIFKNLSGTFPFQKSLRERETQLSLGMDREEGPREPGDSEIERVSANNVISVGGNIYCHVSGDCMI
jgi:hypothetical protein